VKLSLKIPLAVSSAAVMVFACALYGIYTLNQSLTVYGTTVQDNVSNERMVSAVLVEFKFQVQEWKDTLLRGKKTNELDKHWGAFRLVSEPSMSSRAIRSQSFRAQTTGN
jgi:methyl-accepting chemotaxis protein-1 (serine sensor receptor)